MYNTRESAINQQTRNDHIGERRDTLEQHDESHTYHQRRAGIPDEAQLAWHISEGQEKLA